MMYVVRRYLAAIFLLASLILGGASAAGVVANAVLQIGSLFVIAIVLLWRAMPRPSGATRALAWLFAAAAAVMLVQLVPLPPEIWEALPGRADIRAGFALAGVPAPWLPLSLTPDDSIAALLSLLPPLAMLVAILASSMRGRLHAICVLLGFAVVSLALGVIQIVGGEASPAYLYDVTNRGSAVGFFANRNHLATLALIALPFAAALARRPTPGWSVSTRRALRVATALLCGSIAAGVVMIGSVAGWVLLAPVALGCIVVGGGKPRPMSLGRAMRGTILAGAIAAVLLLACAALLTLRPGVGDPDPQHRGVLTSTTLRAALDYLPFGAGGGSFAQIYPSYEDPATVSPEYVNHAHDDYAEVLLDYGLAGALLVVAAVGLWIACGIAAWRRDDDWSRPAFVAVGVVLAHSCVDYPMRTAAVAVSAAMAAALAVSPDATVERRSSKRRPERHDHTGISVSIDDF